MIITEKFPFVSILKSHKKRKNYVGVIQNISKSLISFYDLDLIKKHGQLAEFIALSNTWWKITPCIPLCVFYREKMDKFNYAKICCQASDISIVEGCKGIRLKALSERRIKRKIIVIC